jgi:RNA-directed DNA polymerase
MKKGWTGVKWFIDIDIKGYFDNIDHETLMKLLEKKIEDTQFLALIRDMLHAGYVEDWQYHKTYSGTPQGGIISPILANIYLHEFDEFIESKKREFDQGKERRLTRDYLNVRSLVAYYRRRIEKLKGDQNPDTHTLQRYMQKVRELSKQQRSLPASDPLDPNVKRLFYARYADDFLIGIIGSRQEAETIFSECQEFLNTYLKLTISEEKSGIHHAKEGTPFLGYVVQNFTSEYMSMVRSPSYTKVGAVLRRNMREGLQLRIPQRKMSEFSKSKGYGVYETLHPSRKPILLQLDDEEILLAYNAEMRGIANYYALATGAKQGLQRLMYIAETSFLMTLANKHNSTVSQIASKLRQGNDLVVTTYTKEGKIRRYKLFKLRDWKPSQPKDDVDTMPKTGTYLRFNRSSLEQRLNTHVCESCGKEGGFFEVHHIRKLKDVQGKEGWKQIMIARKRKTLVLCNECHDLLHAGKLSDRQKKF